MIDIFENGFDKGGYLYVGLPGLNALDYVEGDNWLGVALAALMKIPHERVAWLGAEALRRIQAAPLNDQQRFLLGECVQAYLSLDEAQQREFEQLVVTEPYKGVQAMNMTWYEKGIEKGIEKAQAMNSTSYEKGIEKGIEKAQAMNSTWYEKGIEKGIEKGSDKGIEKERRESVRELLEERFGPLSTAVLTTLERLPIERLPALRKAILKAESLRELGLED